MRKTFVVKMHATHEKRKPTKILDVSSNISGWSLDESIVDIDARIVREREINTISTTIKPTS